MLGGGEADYNISWTGLSPNIFREHMAPLFSDLREERELVIGTIILELQLYDNKITITYYYTNLVVIVEKVVVVDAVVVTILKAVKGRGGRRRSSRRKHVKV